MTQEARSSRWCQMAHQPDRLTAATDCTGLTVIRMCKPHVSEGEGRANLPALQCFSRVERVERVERVTGTEPTPSAWELLEGNGTTPAAGGRKGLQLARYAWHATDL